jgi:hypothetical protein
VSIHLSVPLFFIFKTGTGGWRCSYVVELWTRICEALDLILSMGRKIDIKRRERERERERGGEE